MQKANVRRVQSWRYIAASRLYGSGFAPVDFLYPGSKLRRTVARYIRSERDAMYRALAACARDTDYAKHNNWSA